MCPNGYQQRQPTCISQKFWMVILYAFIAIIFTALFLQAFRWLFDHIWNNSFVTSNPWTYPIGVLFSLSWLDSPRNIFVPRL